MDQDFISSDEVLRRLQIEKEELDIMIEEGELKAYRDGAQIKFLKSDVETLKANKMDQPTIVSSEADGVMLIEEIQEEVPAPLNSQLEPLLTMSSANKLGSKDPFDSLDDDEASKPILDVSAEPVSKPLLDLYHQEKENSSSLDDYGVLRADTEELVFEQESGDDLLETGELLFESRDQILPRDKEMEELFTNSEIGISPFDSEERKAIEEAWDFTEEEEDIISASPSFSDSLAIDKSKRRKKYHAVGGITTGILAFVVLALFILKPGPRSDFPKVKVWQVKEVSFQNNYKIEGVLGKLNYKEIPIRISEDGYIYDLPTRGQEVQVGDVIARLKSSAYQEIKLKYGKITRKIAEVESTLIKKQKIFQVCSDPNIKSVMEKYKSFKKEMEKYQKATSRSKSKKAKKKCVKTALKFDVSKEINPIFFKKAESFKGYYKEYRKLYKDYKKKRSAYRKNKKDKSIKSVYSEARRKYRNARRKYYQNQTSYIQGMHKYLDSLSIAFEAKDVIITELQKLKKQKRILMDEKRKCEQNIQNSKQVLIKTPVSGTIEKVNAYENKRVGKGYVFCKMKVPYRFVQFLVQKPDALESWEVNSKVKMLLDNEMITGKILRKVQNSSAISLEILSGECRNLNESKKIFLTYKKEWSGLGVPKKAIVKSNSSCFVMIVKDKKVYKRSVKFKLTNKGDYNPIVEGVYQGDVVVISGSKKLEDLKEKQSVIIENN